MKQSVLRWSLLVGCLVWSTSCAVTSTDDLEEARFSLDGGDFATAVTKLESLTGIATNHEATLLLASAYAGRAGLDLLSLAKVLSTESNETEIFKKIHEALVGVLDSTNGLTDIGRAITTLNSFATANDPSATDTAERRYRLGMLQMIRAFIFPTITAKPTSGAALNPLLILTKDDVQSDFIASDNNLTNDGSTGGLATDNQLVDVLRKNFCALKERSAASGFTVAELQDLTLCQLTSNPSNLRAADFQSASITLCSDFSFSCTGSNGTDTTE